MKNRVRYSNHTVETNADQVLTNSAILRFLPSMMFVPLGFVRGWSQCSAEVVFPNMPLRGWATYKVQLMISSVERRSGAALAYLLSLKFTQLAPSRDSLKLESTPRTAQRIGQSIKPASVDALRQDVERRGDGHRTHGHTDQVVDVLEERIVDVTQLRHAPVPEPDSCSASVAEQPSRPVRHANEGSAAVR